MYIEYNLKSIESEIINIENKIFLKVGNTSNVFIKINKEIYTENNNFIIRNEGKIIGIGKFLWFFIDNIYIKIEKNYIYNIHYIYN